MGSVSGQQCQSLVSLHGIKWSASVLVPFEGYIRQRVHVDAFLTNQQQQYLCAAANCHSAVVYRCATKPSNLPFLASSQQDTSAHTGSMKVVSNAASRRSLLTWSRCHCCIAGESRWQGLPAVSVAVTSVQPKSRCSGAGKATQGAVAAQIHNTGVGLGSNGWSYHSRRYIETVIAPGMSCTELLGVAVLATSVCLSLLLSAVSAAHTHTAVCVAPKGQWHCLTNSCFLTIYRKPLNKNAEPSIAQHACRSNITSAANNESVVQVLWQHQGMKTLQRQ